MTDHFEAKVIKAISETMTCDKCPCPCEAKSSSTMYNCAKQWVDILSQIDTKSDWEEIIDEICTLWRNKKYNPVTYDAYEEETHD